MIKFSIFAVAVGLSLTGCNNAPPPAPESKATPVTPQTTPVPPSTPVASVPDGSAAEIGKAVNGAQPEKK